MFTWVVYLLIGIAVFFIIIAALIIILNFLIGVIMDKHAKEVKETAAKYIVEEIEQINIVLSIFIKMFHLKDKLEKKSGEAVIKFIGYIRVYLLILTISSLICSFCLFGISASVQSYNDATTWFVTNYFNLFGDNECVCYAKCSDNEEVDNKCTYELLFGENEYNKLIESLNLTTTDEGDLEQLESGREIGQFIIDHLTNEAVQEYKSIVGNNNKFRSVDGNDRSKMSNDELKEDLIKLLSDYKENGRNPNCSCCKTLNVNEFYYECWGEPHYVPGFTWEDIWGGDDPVDGGDDDDSIGGVNGGATGEYAIALDDGNYYWYHQSNEACANNVNDATYGRVSDILAGGPSNNDLASRGCGVYTLAICLSNLKGSPVTPYDVITDLMGSSLQSSTPYYYFESYEDNGIKYSSDSVYMYRPKLVELIEAEYSQYGIHAVEVEWNQTNIDTYLNSSDKIAYVINSWGSTSGDDPDFLWYKLSGGHFMAIRKKEGDNYYCFTSCSAKPNLGSTHANAQQAMNSGISWSVMNSYAKHDNALIIWRDVSSIDTGNGGDSGGTGDISIDVNVYERLASSPEFSGKARILAATYDLCMQTWGDENIAIGMMANVYSEGKPGIVEGMWHKSIGSGGANLTCNHTAQGADCKCVYAYWTQVDCSIHNLAYTYIDSQSDVQTLLSIPSNVQGIGIGPVQWSGGRRKGILTRYATLSSFTEDDMMMCDIQYMKDELLGTYKGVINMCRGQSAEQCAKLICTEYESPSNENAKAVARASVATNLSNLLSN